MNRSSLVEGTMHEKAHSSLSRGCQKGSEPWEGSQGRGGGKGIGGVLGTRAMSLAPTKGQACGKVLVLTGVTVDCSMRERKAVK